MTLTKLRKCSCCHAFVAVAFAILSSTSAYAVGSGMFLCRSPVVANDYWNDLLTAQQAGVKINRDIATSIAQKNECEFVTSSNLKPINFVGGQFAITDGKVTGWASPQLYILYVNGQNSN